jgi:hypothetical protein
MAENSEYIYDQSFYVVSLTRVYEIIKDFFTSSLRLYIGFLLASSFINTTSLLTWCLELSLVNYFLQSVITKFLDEYYPRIIQNRILLETFKKMLSLGIVGVLYQRSLLVLLFSESLYWLFTYYSKIFSRLLVESLTVYYYYQSLWFIFPLLINVFLSVLYFIDTVHETELLASFSQFSFFKFFLNEWGIAITSFHPPLETKLTRKQFISSKAFKGLSDEDNYHFSILKQRYFPFATHQTLEEGIRDLEEFLADQYYKHQVCYVDNKQNIHVLPLNWNEFQRSCSRVAGHERLKMLKAYYQNSYHGAWRLLSRQPEWKSNDKISRSLLNELQQFKNLEFIITIWNAIRHEHGISKDPQVFKIKSEMFIKILAKINRFRNGHMYHGRREDDLDDLLADKMANMDVSFNLLFQLVCEKHQEEKLTPNVLIKLLHSFTKTLWTESLSKLEEEHSEELARLWDIISTHGENFQEHETHFEIFKLSNHHKDDFYLKMNALFGKKWLDDTRYKEIIDIHFESEPQHQLLKHSHIFSEVLREFDVTRELKSQWIFSF